LGARSRKTEARAGRRETKPLVIEVREPREHGAGHLPGALNVPRGVMELQKEDGTMTRKSRMLVTMLMALGTIGTGARSAHAAGAQVPFGGAYAGTLAFTSPTTAALSGTGIATYLGPSTNQGLVTMEGPASCGGFAVINNETLTAPNGDALSITIHDVSCPISPGVYHGTGTYVVTGGTGRFSGATGQGSFDGRGDFNHGQFAFVLTGTVSAPTGR
jgi:hypothetical protein